MQLRRQQVEFAQDQQGTRRPRRPPPTPAAARIRNSLDPGDWIALNNRFTFAHMDQAITFRFASNGAAGSTRGLVEVRLDSPTGPVAATCTLLARANNAFTSQRCASPPR